jgi:hypothetical protein
VLRYMFPGHAVDHLMHSSRADSKVIRDGLLCFFFRKLLSYLTYFFFGKNRFGVVYTTLARISIFAVAVIHVVGWCTKEQVQRVNTSSIITRMADVKFSRVTFVSNHVRKSVSPNEFFVDVKVPIARTRDSSSPQPTVVVTKFFNPLPKSQFSFFYVHTIYSTINGSIIQ